MRRAAKVDLVQEEVVTCLRLIGAEVQSMAAIGKGCPDLLISYKNAWYAAECKTGEKADWTEDQLAFKLRHKAPVLRFNGAGDAMAWAAGLNAIEGRNENNG